MINDGNFVQDTAEARKVGRGARTKNDCKIVKNKVYYKIEENKV